MMKVLFLFFGLLLMFSCQTAKEDNQLDQVFMVTEQLPVFLSDNCKNIEDLSGRIRCSENKFLKELFNSLNYNGNAEFTNYTKLHVEFIISGEGLVESVNILPKLEAKLNQSVVGFLCASRWIPARQSGKAVRFKKTLPVNLLFE